MTALAWKEFTPAARLGRLLARTSAGEAAALCDQAGIDRRHGARSMRGRRIPADPFLALCAVVGIDPATGEVVPVSEAAPVLWWFFSCGISVRRHLDRLNIRDAARLAGVSPSTFSAAERGKPVAAESYVKLSAYVGIHPLGFTATTAAQSPISPKIQPCASACHTGNATQHRETVPYTANHLERDE